MDSIPCGGICWALVIDEAAGLSLRGNEKSKRLSNTLSDPKILFGMPAIAGTRISVELILEELRTDASVDDLLREYPHLNREQILEAMRYAAQAIRTDNIYPLTPVLT